MWSQFVTTSEYRKDFMFRLTPAEREEISSSQFVMMKNAPLSLNFK